MGNIQLKTYQFRGGSNEKSDGKWYPRVEHYSTVSTEQLCQLAADDSHVERAEVQYVLSAVAKQIEELVLLGHSVQIPELGTISLGAESSTTDDYDEVYIDRLLKRLRLNLRVSPELRDGLKKVSLRLRHGDE